MSRPHRHQALVIVALTPVVLALAAAGVLLLRARRRGVGRSQPPDAARAGPGSWEPPSGEGDGAGSRDATVVDLHSRLLGVPGRERGHYE
jgi:hypothetical protein